MTLSKKTSLIGGLFVFIAFNALRKYCWFICKEVYIKRNVHDEQINQEDELKR